MAGRTLPHVIAIPFGSPPLAVVFRRASAEQYPADVFKGAQVEIRRGGLFRTIADVETTEAGVAKFRADYDIDADKIYRFVLDMRTGERLDESDVTVPNRSAKEWGEQISSLRRSTRLWDMLQSNNTAELKRHIRWEDHPEQGLSVTYYPDKDVSYPDTSPMPFNIATAARSPWLMARFRRDDPVEPALEYLANRFTKWLGRVEARVLHTTRADHKRPFGLAGDATQGLALLYTPADAFTAIWLQFAEAVAANKQFRRCAECHSWFEIGRGTTHKDREYCSSICKVNAYRSRQNLRRADARRAFLAGVPDRAIVKANGIDLEQLRTWTADLKRPSARTKSPQSRGADANDRTPHPGGQERRSARGRSSEGSDRGARKKTR